jgi:DNA-binding NarL/FixJ family response regulator
MTIRVLIADDERLVRTGLRMILAGEADISVIGEAADGQAAIDASRRDRPDVVLMDVRMPVLDGIAATRRIVARASRATGGETAPRIIILTTFDLDEHVFEALRAGASAFLLKDAPEAHLIAAIRVVADGGSLFAPAVTRRFVEAFASASTNAAAGIPPGLDELTPREREVLVRLAHGESNREIADGLGITEHTTKTHVAHVLGKLDLRDRVQAVVLAYESGLVRPGDHGPPLTG